MVVYHSMVVHSRPDILPYTFIKREIIFIKASGVSIITPTFNHEHYLNDSLVGVNRQTYQYFKHIVIDGGSTDSFCILKFANQVSG